jgi:hypothetical protein
MRQVDTADMMPPVFNGSALKRAWSAKAYRATEEFKGESDALQYLAAAAFRRIVGSVARNTR